MHVEKKKSETGRQVRSWYGLHAQIAVESNLWHLVRVGGIPLNHPPLVNLLLRWGQPPRRRLHLSFLHEFGHLQTLPPALLHLLWLLVEGRWRERGIKGCFSTLLTAFVAHQAVWELASESYVVAKSGREYGRILRDHPNPIGQLTFWGGMGVAAFYLSRRVKQVQK